MSLFAIGYAHWELHRFVRGRTLLLRVFLLGLGTAMGVVIFGLPGAQNGALDFVIGFGLAHVPPAILLFLKRLRGEGKS